MENKGLLTLKEAANFLGVKPVTLRKWDNEGKLKAVRIGNRHDRRYHMADLVRMLKVTPSEKIDWQEYLRKKIAYNVVLPIIEGATERLKKYWGVNYRYHMSYGREDTYYWCCSVKDNLAVGERAIKLYAKPSFAVSLTHKWRRMVEEMRSWSESLRRINFKKVKTGELKNWYRKAIEASAEYEGAAIAIDGVDESGVKHLSELIKESLARTKSSLTYSETFDILSSPSSLSAAGQRDWAIGKLAFKIQKQALTKTQEKLAVQKIIDEFWWLNLGWDVYDADHEELFKKALAEMLSDKKLSERLKNWQDYHEVTENRKENLIKKLGVVKDIRFKNYIKVVNDFTIFHDWRKEFQMRQIYVQMKLLGEIARRLKIPFTVLEWAAPSEVVALLNGEKLDLPAIYRRSEGYVVLIKNGQREVYFGDEAGKKWNSERAPAQVINDLQGVSASRGKVTGEAFVVLSQEELGKIKEGQILVTSQTTPEFVPAMKKAAAIVTDEGGLTCHAAIISRELGKPCIVGTKYATRILRTGQLIEVVANHGVVRILK